MNTDTFTLLDILFGISFATMFIAMIFHVLFGQVTMRKLRKNPATKEVLGVEFISGWDTFNVASALAMPRWFNKKMQNSSLFYLHANAEILDENTTKFDKILAIIFYTLYTYSAISLILLGIYDTFFVD